MFFLNIIEPVKNLIAPIISHFSKSFIVNNLLLCDGNNKRSIALIVLIIASTSPNGLIDILYILPNGTLKPLAYESIYNNPYSIRDNNYIIIKEVYIGFLSNN